MSACVHWPEDAERLFSPEQVAHAWDALTDAVMQRLEQRAQASPIIALAVMNGGLFPLAELTRRLSLPLQIDYVHATRYRNETQGGDIDWQRWPARNLSDHTVLLVDDIFDEGHTLAAVKQRLNQQTQDVISIVLARKQHARGLERNWVDFYGLNVPDRFVFGCGMDIQGHWRHLDAIWAVNEDVCQ